MGSSYPQNNIVDFLGFLYNIAGGILVLLAAMGVLYFFLFIAYIKACRTLSYRGIVNVTIDRNTLIIISHKTNQITDGAYVQNQPGYQGGYSVGYGSSNTNFETTCDYSVEGQYTFKDEPGVIYTCTIPFTLTLQSIVGLGEMQAYLQKATPQIMPLYYNRRDRTELSHHRSTWWTMVGVIFLSIVLWVAIPFFLCGLYSRVILGQEQITWEVVLRVAVPVILIQLVISLILSFSLRMSNIFFRGQKHDAEKREPSEQQVVIQQTQ